jgi:glycosyltransferase involved in cell wall biosynthesis
MKVAVVVDSLNFGGAERQSVELARGLSLDHEVHLVTCSASQQGYGALVQSMQIPVHQLDRQTRIDGRPLLRLIGLFRKHRFDVVHTFMNVGSLLGLLAARATGTPVVCSPFRDAHPGSFRSESVKRLVAHLADLCVANSKAGFDARYDRWRKNFRVVYNGLDLTRFEPLSSRARAQLLHDLSLGRFRRLVGMAGRLSPHKDHRLLLLSARCVLDKYPDVGFLIIGDGTTRQSLETMAKDLGIFDNICFTGYRSDVDIIYHLLDVAVLLTDVAHAAEGTPNAIIEPMACGVPVVATRSGGTPEALTHGVEGLLVAPGSVREASQALDQLLSDSAEAQAMGIRARATVQRQFSLASYVSACLELYRELLSGQTSGGRRG